MNKRGNKLKAVIFDIDGTLIDSTAAHAESFVAAFKKFGKTVPDIFLGALGKLKNIEKGKPSSSATRLSRPKRRPKRN